MILPISSFFTFVVTVSTTAYISCQATHNTLFIGNLNAPARKPERQSLELSDAYEEKTLKPFYLGFAVDWPATFASSDQGAGRPPLLGITVSCHIIYYLYLYICALLELHFTSVPSPKSLNMSIVGTHLYKLHSDHRYFDDAPLLLSFSSRTALPPSHNNQQV